MKPMTQRKFHRDYYCQTGSVVVAANSSDSIVIQIHDQTRFRLDHIYFVSTGAGEIQLQDGSASKVLSQDYLDIRLFNGFLAAAAIGDNRGFQLPQSYTFQPKSQIIINVRDTSGAQNTIKAYLSGCRIFEVK